MIDATRDGLWALFVLLGWVEEPERAVEVGATVGSDG